MGEQTCVQCGAPFSDQASICPNCGAIVGAAAPTDAPPVAAANVPSAMPPTVSPVTLEPPPPIAAPPVPAPNAPSWVTNMVDPGTPPPPGSLSPAGGYAGPPAMATTSWKPAPDAAPKKGSGMLGAIASVVAAVVAGVVVYTLTKGASIPELPPTLLGEGRATSTEAQELEQSFDAQIATTDATGDAIVYGTGPTPSFLVAVYAEPRTISFEEEYSLFTDGFASTGGALDEEAQVDGTQGDWTIRCVPLVDAPASVCVSGHGRVFVASVYMTEGDGAVAMTQTQEILTALEPPE